MKITTDTIQLDGKTYEATEVDYNSYTTEPGQITLDGKTYKAIKVLGLERPANLICSNTLLCSDSAII